MLLSVYSKSYNETLSNELTDDPSVALKLAFGNC